MVGKSKQQKWEAPHQNQEISCSDLTYIQKAERKTEWPQFTQQTFEAVCQEQASFSGKKLERTLEENEEAVKHNLSDLKKKSNSKCT